MGYSFKDYIAESTKYMYDDNYIIESKFVLNGKEYPSKKAAETDLIKKGLSGAKLKAALSHGKFATKEKPSHSMHGYMFWDDKEHKDRFKKSAEEHGLTLHHHKSYDNIGDKPYELRGKKEHIEKFIKTHKLSSDEIGDIEEYK